MQPINRLTRSEVETYITTGRTLNGYQQLATKSAIYPGQTTPLGLAYVALKLNGEAGEFAEHVGKAMRDDSLIKSIGGVDDYGNNLVQYDPVTLARSDALIKEIGDVLWYLSAACNELGITLQEAANQNLLKLLDRTERGALRGSGDNR